MSKTRQSSNLVLEIGLASVGLLASAIAFIANFRYSGAWLATLLAIPAFWGIRFFLLGGLTRQWKLLPDSPFNLSIALLSLMMLVSIYATYDLAQSVPKLIGLFWSLHWYFYIISTARVPGARYWQLAGFAFAMLTLIGFGAVFLRYAVPVLGQVRTTQLQEVLNPNELAGTLTWGLPLFLVLIILGLGMAFDWRSKRGWWERAGLFLLALASGLGAIAGLLVSYWSLSRSAWMGLAAGFIFIPLWWLAQRIRWWSLVIPLMLVIGVGVFTALGGLQPLLGEAETAGGVAIGQLAPSQSLEGRLELWSRGIYAMEDFPLTGMGMNTFRKLVHILYPVFSYSPTQDFGHAHNLLIQVGVDLGIPGLIAYLAIGFGCVWLCWQSWQTGESLWERWLVLGLMAGLVAHAGFGMSDAVALGAKPGFIGWWVVGMVGARTYNPI